MYCFTPADGHIPRDRARATQPSRAVSAQLWARRARLGPRCLAALALCAGACATGRSARAADASPDATGEAGTPMARSDASPGDGGLSSLGLHAALSFATLSEDDEDQAELVLTGADLDFALGLRLGERVRLAYEATLGFRSVVGVTQRYASLNGSLLKPSEGQLGFLLPLGFCIDYLPYASQGLYGSVHFGGGVFRAPDLIPQSEFHFAGRIALDLGWKMPLDNGNSLGVSARYSLLGLKRVYLDENYNNVLAAHEVSAGVQWNF